MLTTTNLVGFGADSGSPFLLDIIRELGLTANLNLVLDAGDTRSYDGSSQTWTDASGNGNNFFRGTTIGADATDPTFNGTAGVATEGTYFSFDGGDYFTETAAHTFADNWHKDNGALSIIAVQYGAGFSFLFSNTPASTADGIQLTVGAANSVFSHAITNATVETLTGPAATSTWNFVGVSFNEAGPTTDLRTNATASAPSTTASTTTDNNSQPIRIGAAGDATQINPAGERLACVAAWSTPIGATALAALYARLKARRFPSLP
jgi:hypothetical protein